MKKVKIFLTKENFSHCKKVNEPLFSIIEKYKINAWTKVLTITEAQAELFYYFFGSCNVEVIYN